MRVAYVSSDPGVSVLGTKGCSIHVQSVVREFLRRGFQVDLYARRLGDSTTIELPDVNVIRLESPDKNLDAEQREAALRLLDRQTRIALERNCPYDLVYERHSLWSAAAMQYAQDRGIRSILEVNAPLVEEQSQHRGLCNRQEAEQISRDCFQSADSIVCVSKAVADYVRRFEISSSKIRVIANGVDPDRAQSAREMTRQRTEGRCEGTPVSPLRIGFLGTLRPWHGMRELGLAFREVHRRIPDAELLVIGDGPAREQLLTALGVEAAQATTITGKVAHTLVPDLLGNVDIAVAPYPDLPGFYFSPLKILEYMAVGLPIVASRIGEIPNIISDRMSGLLVEPGNPDVLAAEVIRLAKNPAFASLLGDCAAKAVQQRFTWKHVVSASLSLSTPIRHELRSAGGA